MKRGYKQTEVGVIPEDWDSIQIGSIVDEISMGPFGSDITVSNFVSSGVPVLNGANVSYERLTEEFENFVTSKKAHSLKKAVARRGDIVVTHRGTIGQISYIPDDSEFERYVVSQSQFRVRFSRRVLPEWVVRYFHSEGGQRGLLEGKGHTGVPAIAQPTTTFRKLFIPLPLHTEQSAIATVLSDVDALLAGVDKLIAKQRDIKQAAMQQLLTGKTRLPGFAGEWEVKRLDVLASIRSGGTPSTGIAKFWDGDIPWCTPTDITQLDGGKYLVSTSRTISQDGLNNSSAEMIPANSVVMTSRATIGECAINSVPVTTNQGFKNFVPFDATDVEFLYYLLQTQKQGFIRLCAGSTFLEIGKMQLAAYEVRVPAKKEEQAAIAEVLSDMDAELEKLQARREKTRLLKQGMMQELLTGRTRLVQLVAQPASNVVPFKKPAEAKPTERKANVHFQRSVFAAEIVERLHNEPAFGHVKLEKLIYLAEHLCKVDIDSHYHRDAAGPYDNRALRSIDSQMERQQWFKLQKDRKPYRYVPMSKYGGHKQYFDRYFSEVTPAFDNVIDAFKRLDWERCEIVATLYEAWRDLLAKNADASDDAIVDQVLNHWHDAKKRIEEDRWRKALVWMREKGFVPEGAV